MSTTEKNYASAKMEEKRREEDLRFKFLNKEQEKKEKAMKD